MYFNPFLFANERTEMKLKIYLSEAWMCSEFGMLITDVERERVKSEFELKNRRSTARVGILLSLVLTLDVFCTHESLTSQCKWHMHRPCTIKSLHTGF